ncbi:MAG: prolyl oligopeptidase family serine peptidase [Planctomycetes bacterium]|nr:prolyl oligopeptidase family serine peptidase [Planctomycetota bacterium]
MPRITEKPPPSRPSNQLRRKYLACLGAWPKAAPLRIETLERSEHDGYVREKLRFQTLPGAWVPAYLLIPHRLKSPAAALLCLHQHAGQFELGKSEAVGRIGSAHANYALRFAREGFVTFAFDARCFEERRTYWDGDGIERDKQSMLGTSLAKLMLWDIKRALDVMATRPEIDARRIGAVGHSMGGFEVGMAMGLEPRISCGVISCGMRTYEGTFRRGERVPAIHYVPGLYAHMDLPEVYGLAAPRPLLVMAGKRDTTCKYEDFQAAAPVLKKAYAQARAKQKLDLFAEDVPHTFSETMYARATRWFRKWV